MRFFFYGRKSVYSDTSDSIDNQERMCRDFCEARFPHQVDVWTAFCDEAYSGKNTDRPDFQRMMARIRDGEADVVVVYMLDRFSRDVKDFAVSYETLQRHGVRFLCLDLNIDTSTPIGEAMMYVTAAFAQMERKNIAQRVADNMKGLASKGYWVGGRPPLGYVSHRIVENGKKHVEIFPDPEKAAYVREFFRRFLAGSFTLGGFETHLRLAGEKSPTGKFFSSTQIHQILRSPFYVAATAEVFDFFQAKGCQMDQDSPRETWDGSTGVMVYGRTTERNGRHQLAPPESWIVCKGRQEPIVDADTWLAVNELFRGNKCYHDAKYDTPLLKGVLRCSCGAQMRVSRKKRVPGGVSSWYYCSARMRKGVDYCDRAQIKMELLDEKVLEVLRSISSDPSMIRAYASQSPQRGGADSKSLKRSIGQLEAQIGRLAASLALSENSPAGKYIIQEIERLDAQLQDLKSQLSAAESEERREKAESISADEKAAVISEMISGLSGFSADEKNSILRRCGLSAVWDGETLTIMF